MVPKIRQNKNLKYQRGDPRQKLLFLISTLVQILEIDFFYCCCFLLISSNERGGGEWTSYKKSILKLLTNDISTSNINYPLTTITPEPSKALNYNHLQSLTIFRLAASAAATINMFIILGKKYYQVKKYEKFATLLGPLNIHVNYDELCAGCVANTHKTLDVYAPTQSPKKN